MLRLFLCICLATSGVATANTLRAPYQNPYLPFDETESQFLVSTRWTVQNVYFERVDDKPFMQFIGNGIGADVSYNQVYDYLYFGGRYSLIVGNQAYEAFPGHDSDLQGSSIPLGETNVQMMLHDGEVTVGAKYWYALDYLFSFGINIEAGLGFRLYQDQFGNFVYTPPEPDATPIVGMNRSTLYHYAPVRLGLSGKLLGLGIGGTYSVKPLLHGTNYSEMDAQINLKHIQRSGLGMGFEAFLWYDVLELVRVQLTVYAKSWDVADSEQLFFPERDSADNIVVDQQGVMQVLQIYEPQARTDEIGASLSIGYALYQSW